MCSIIEPALATDFDLYVAVGILIVTGIAVTFLDRRYCR